MLYFAYGSNMSRSRMEKRKTGYESCGSAVLRDYKLTFNKKAGYTSYSYDDSIYPKMYDLKETKTLWKHTDHTKLIGQIKARPEFREASEGYANVVPSVGDCVEGVLYVVPEDGIVALDSCEGYPTHYDREVLTVELANGAQVQAIVYVATWSYQEDNLLPSDEYLAHLIAGKEFLSDEYFQKLASQKTVKKKSYSSYSGSGYNGNSGYYSNRGSGYNRGASAGAGTGSNYSNYGRRWNPTTRQYEDDYEDDYINARMY